jgi:excisionase family DNA binding protein
MRNNEDCSSPSLTTKQASEYLNCSKDLLRLWREQGRGPRYFKLGRIIRYRPSDLETWISKRKVITAE